MLTKNIECQIAQAQLRRYLTGEDMPNAVVEELETHLKHCPDCMAAAQSLRESLKGVLARKISGKPEPKAPEPARRAIEPIAAQVVVQESRPETVAAVSHAVVQTPADILDQPDSAFNPPKPKKASNVKTLLYSGALALVLVLMSTVFQDPTKLFGPRALSAVPDTPTTEPPAASETEVPTDAKIESPIVDEPETDQQTAPQQDEAPTTTQKPAVSNALPTAPLKTDGLIVAGGSGTEVIKNQPKPQPKSSPSGSKKSGAKNGVGTMKVYPPDKN